MCVFVQVVCNLVDRWACVLSFLSSDTAAISDNISHRFQITAFFTCHLEQKEKNMKGKDLIEFYTKLSYAKCCMFFHISAASVIWEFANGVSSSIYLYCLSVCVSSVTSILSVFLKSIHQPAQRKMFALKSANIRFTSLFWFSPTGPVLCFQLMK